MSLATRSVSFVLTRLFVSISLVDNGGTQAQGCVTTVSWQSVWGGVIVAGLQRSKGYLQALQPRGRKHSLGSGWQAYPSEKHLL